jgi:putative tryptophan/tyrosine transport system substrate-binding protein
VEGLVQVVGACLGFQLRPEDVCQLFAMQAMAGRKGEDHGPAKRILVLYPRPSSADDLAITKILQVFETKGVSTHFTVINFTMDDRRGTEAIQFAEKNKVDLIFSMGSESTAWLYDHYRGGAIPVVSVCSKDPVQLGQMKDYNSGSRTNFAFTSLNVPVDVQMTYVRELRPDLKNLAVLVDSKNVSAMQTQAEPINRRPECPAFRAPACLLRPGCRAPSRQSWGFPGPRPRLSPPLRVC